MRRAFSFTSTSNYSRRRKKIAVALSGGVDSSVAAYLLSREHNDIMGIHMSNWDYHNDDDDESNNNSSNQCWEQDWKDAKAVAQHLHIPIVHASFQSEYWTEVFEPYCDQLSRGGVTPNPDVDCNRYIKFGVLKQHIHRRYQIDVLATGHYARLWDPTNEESKLPLDLEEAIEIDPFLYSSLFARTKNGNNINNHTRTSVLLAAKDKSKDQSYFLSGVSGDAFHNVLFPLGDYLKKTPGLYGDQNPMMHSSQTSVRDIAVDANLPTAGKRESMGICFVGKRKHGKFINGFIAPSPCDKSSIIQCINIEDGTVLATCHPNQNNYSSLLFATVGQGAKLSGASQKWFVVDHHKQSNNPTSTAAAGDTGTTLLLCPGTHHPSLYSDSLLVKDMNWIAGVPPPLPIRGAQCRIRHLQPLVDCDIIQRQHGDGFEIILHTPLRGIAPGQVCAIYYHGGLVCLGGGAITRRGPTYWDLQKELPANLHPSGHNDSSPSVQRQASL